MRFLVVTKPKHPIPPEYVVGLLDGLIAWTEGWSSQGKMEQVWGFAGVGGGGGILNVDSLDELDTVMAEFPFAPFSDTEITPLVDLGDAAQRRKEIIQAMMSG